MSGHNGWIGVDLDAPKKPAFRGTLPPPPASPMDLDAEIKEAQDRCARRIGQWGRRDDAIRKRQVKLAHQDVDWCFDNWRRFTRNADGSISLRFLVTL